MALLLLCTVALLVPAILLLPPWFAHLRRRRLRRAPFPAAWRPILRRHVPAVRRLPADLQLRLKGLIQVFLAEKPFIGCAGLVVTDAMRVTVAAQACLLVLGQPGGTLFPNLRQVLLYPGAFLVDRAHVDGSGILQDRRRALAGESWTQGQVILSWDDVQAGAADASDGHNVVVHEFAHQLDQEKGHANGAPLLAGRARRQRWAAVLSAEFDALRSAVAEGLPTLLNPYGATDPAEFFAVASEAFFEQPAALAQRHPALFGELRGYYRLDPLSW